MKRLLATCLAGMLALAVLATAGWDLTADAAVPGDPVLSGIADCASTAADDRALPGEQPENAAAQLLAACQFTKPMNGCKKNPCDGKTYCCGGGDCTTKP